MPSLIKLMTLVWRFRGRLLLCFFIVPALAYLYHQNKVEIYTATTTFYINPSLVTSPLLQDMTPNAHRAILARSLASPDVLTPSLTQTGLLLQGVDQITHASTLRQWQGRLRLNTLSGHLLQIKLQSPDRTTLVPMLEAISTHFRHQLLWPEQTSAEAELQRLNEKRLFYQNQIAEAETTHNVDSLPTLQTSLALAEKDYTLQSRKAQNGGVQGAVRILEDPTLLVTPSTPITEIITSAALLGLLLGLGLVWISAGLERTLRHDKDIHTLLGLRVLGHMPDFGALHVINGRQTT